MLVPDRVVGAVPGEVRFSGNHNERRGERPVTASWWRRARTAGRLCDASLFTDRAISYRETKGFNHLDVALSIGMQRMVCSDRAGSGVMFSVGTETGFPRRGVRLRVADQLKEE